ncbi:MAG: outer membrane protein assembly factor BamE [Roseateles sp.]|uniref:outer membrane protein assembly factor BamE n=1 Tax=Roseateles sp. TaxID=1971397 RepID=UPI0039E9E5B5
MRRRAALACLALLAGCATPGRDARLRPGASTEADVVALYGAPKRVWPEADGGRTLEYSSQPLGQHCWMVRLAADGRLRGVEDTLAPAGRARVVPGMTPEQVSRLLGAERSRVFYRLSGEEVWDWTIAPDGSDYGMRFNVHFKDGAVLRASQSMVFPNRRFPGLD